MIINIPWTFDKTYNFFIIIKIGAWQIESDLQHWKKANPSGKNTEHSHEILPNVWGYSGAKVCRNCRSWKIPQNDFLLANLASMQPRLDPPMFGKTTNEYNRICSMLEFEEYIATYTYMYFAAAQTSSRKRMMTCASTLGIVSQVIAGVGFGV